jgi:hypothetical protein
MKEQDRTRSKYLREGLRCNMLAQE